MAICDLRWSEWWGLTKDSCFLGTGCHGGAQAVPPWTSSCCEGNISLPISASLSPLVSGTPGPTLHTVSCSFPGGP